jgi:hypothetical protein
MLAFLKRRWILLSCAVALMVCSVVDWHFPIGNAQTVECFVGVEKGRSWLIVADANPDREMGWTDDSFHAPMIGLKPEFTWLDDLKWIQFPLWLLLSLVIGWIVFREVRRREKRAKAADACGTN